MPQQTIVWTVLPNGRATDGPHAGRLRVSIVASPRLTPEASGEQMLKAFIEWRNWPKTLTEVKFQLRVDAQVVDLMPTSTSDPELWARLFTDVTPVAGFVFKNMAQVNLRSFAVRNVLGFVRNHYGRLAVQSASTHPTLLPWKEAHPALKDMLTELGTPITTSPSPTHILRPTGFDRFFDDQNGQGIERHLRSTVFGPNSNLRGPIIDIGVDEQGNPRSSGMVPLRVLPPDWRNPIDGGSDTSIMSQWNSAAEYTLYQADRFYRRELPTAEQKAMRRPSLVNVPQPPNPPEFDFHDIIASYSDYPELLRRLGLVIDCVLPVSSPIDLALAGSTQAQGLMALELRWGDAHDPAGDSCPRTAWQADKLRFGMRSRSTDHERGMLHLKHADDRWSSNKRSPFDVYQVDPDGAALKTVDFLLSAQNLVTKSLVPGADGRVTYTTGDKQPVAALRSGGLGISRHGRAEVIAQSAASAALKNQAVQAGAAASKDIVLFTEDVLRGYRVDVQVFTPGNPQRWQSLCRRHGMYRFTGTGESISLSDDEGYVRGASTTSTASSPSSGVDPDDHYLHESLFRWTGWSLVAPRPGRTMRSGEDPASGVQTETPEDVTDEATSGGNGLAVTFSPVKGSLPKLRYGMPYRFRARIVDLAGNSLAFDDRSLKSDENVTDPVTYWRFEPVDPPALVHRTRTSEGESLERMVLRSNWNADTTTYLTTAQFSAAIALPASADFEYTPVNERHAVPPKSSQLQCETHSMFDALFSNPADIKVGYEIAAREAGTLYDGPQMDVKLVTPVALAKVATTLTLPLRLPSPDNPTGDRLAPGQYVIHGEALIETPYLPDPAAGGFALRAMPGHALPGVTEEKVLGPSAAIVRAPNQELVLIVAYGKEWPDSQGLRIVLAERAQSVTSLPCNEAFTDEEPGGDRGLPHWNEETRELTLFVAKGRVIRLRYSSFVHKSFIPALGISDWVDSGGEREMVRKMAQLGCGWMTTPYRSLVLVHATQQPVCEPELIQLNTDTPPRQIGDQHAMLHAHVRLHGPSTGKFEVEAAWDEWVDDLGKSAPELQPSRGALGEILLAENHHNEFDLKQAVDAQQPVLQAQNQDGSQRQTRARGDRHEFGDTKFRLIRYTLRATTRFREYLPAALYEQRDEVTRLGPIAEGQAMNVGADNDPGAPVLIGTGTGLNTVVPASAPPDDPCVLYTVPTFRWIETPSTGTLDTTRLGNGLRVWLERPWFSSGNGELLGVVILGESQPFTDITDRLVPLVTQWGLDPLWDTALPKHRSRVSDFPAKVADEDVELREIEDKMVRVVGHRVHWDASRRLWYCDIELDPGRSYMPFVRLALVRYQPNALPKAKISKVVLTEFSQVLPRRRAQFQRNGAQLTFSLRGSVPAHGPMKFPLDSEYQDFSFIPLPGQATETGRNKVELVLQTRDPEMDSDLAWGDVAVLASSLLAPAGTTAGGDVGGDVLQPNPIFRLPAQAPAPATVRDRLGSRVDLSGAFSVGSTGAIDVTALGPAIEGPSIIQLGDPVIWQSNVTVPDTANKPTRIAVREYERYYTDRTVPEVLLGATRRRRVVEERLVYTAFFNL